MAKAQQPASAGGAGGKGTFDLFGRVFSFFEGSNDPDRNKRKQLREIAKQLKRQKLSFYKARSGETQPAFAKFLHDLYKVVNPSKILIENATESNVLKSIVITSFLTPTQREIQENLEEESIRRQLEQTDPKLLAQNYKEMLGTFFSGFDTETARQINDTYNLLTIFLQFVRFDYFFVLKKFDSRLPENDFRYRAGFDSIDGKYVSDDIKDFLEVAPLIEAGADWNRLFELLEVYKGAPIMTQKAWRPMLATLTEVLRSGILPLMVRHIDEDPYYKSKLVVPNHKIVEEYLSKTKNQTEITIQKLLSERRSSKIDSLATAVFGSASVSRMRNYTDVANLAFSKKMLGGFIYVSPMNYLKAFFLDFLKGDIKNVIDGFLIRGQWSTPVLSQQLSESFHKLMEASQQLLAFDADLSEDEQRGRAIKNAMTKSDRDQAMIRVFRQYLSDANQEALTIIKESVQHLIAVAEMLKTVLDDHRSKSAEVILNWREIRSGFSQDIDAEIESIYRKIYYLAQLLQYFVKK